MSNTPPLRICPRCEKPIVDKDLGLKMSLQPLEPERETVYVYSHDVIWYERKECRQFFSSPRLIANRITNS